MTTRGVSERSSTVKYRPCDKRNTHGAKIVAVGEGEMGELQLPFCGGHALDGVSRCCETRRCGEGGGDAHGDDSRLFRKPVDDGAVEVVDGTITWDIAWRAD